ncbi:MAG: ABC transporter ATP-binding protein [Anaerovoracaceae bacterium]|nr:ABC transporter ATP-binding protein [Anaerovoracaceae bacterium]
MSDSKEKMTSKPVPGEAEKERERRRKETRRGHRGGGPMAMMPGERAENFGATLKTLTRYLADYKIAMIFVLIFAIGSTIFSIVGPSILGDATDEIVRGFMRRSMDWPAITRTILTLVVIYGVSFILSLVQGVMMSDIAQKITYKMREQISEKLDRLPLKYFDGTTHGEVQSRVINDVETINQTLNNSLTQTITSFTMLAGILIMMIRISLVMTVVALVVLPLSFTAIRLVVKRSQGRFRDQQNLLSDVNAHVEEMYTGHLIVKAFSREKESLETFDEINDSLCEAAFKSQFYSGIMMPATQFIGNLGYVAVCVLGGYLALHGKVTIGNIQAFIQYVRSFNQPLQQVANVMNMLQSTAAAAERIFAFIDEEDEPDAYGSDDSDKVHLDMSRHRGEVSFRHVRFGYEPGKPIIHDFSYVAKPGSQVAIVGPTGAGKTTIVKLIMRYYELDSGDIWIDDHDIRDYSRRELRSLFGMVLQDTWLFSGTIRENIRYGKPGATDEEVEDAAKAAHIHNFIKAQPGGYDMVINEEATNISQGQKQLLTIARAMLANRPILILDEATSSVDTRTEKQIQDAMTRLMKGRTSFVIAHRLSTIKDADWILVMDHGDIVEQGAHEELLGKGGFYADLYNSQFES